jgi:hypothetical protein
VGAAARRRLRLGCGWRRARLGSSVG